MFSGILEWAGCLLGIAGALVLAINRPWSKWGFYLYLFSNLAWVGFAIMNKQASMLICQVCFTVTSVIGIYRWRNGVVN